LLQLSESGDVAYLPAGKALRASILRYPQRGPMLRFPFAAVSIRSRRTTCLSHGWLKFVHDALPLLSGQYRNARFVLDLRWRRVMHIYFVHPRHLLPFIEQWPTGVVSFHGADVAHKNTSMINPGKAAPSFKAVPLVFAPFHSLATA